MTEKNKKPDPLTAADFARYAPNANSELTRVSLQLETLKEKAFVTQVEILVSVREVACACGFDFQALLEASSLEFEDTLD